MDRHALTAFVTSIACSSLAKITQLYGRIGREQCNSG